MINARQMAHDLLNAAADYLELAGLVRMGTEIRKYAHQLEEGFDA